MDYFVIGDTHFGHEAIKKYEKRPHNFEDKILKNLGRINPCRMVLIFLGDLVLNSGQEEYWIGALGRNTLNLRKWLVKGNHDKKSDSWYMDRGFDMVCDSFTLKRFSKKITFSHKPIPNHEGGINIHGHLHTLGQTVATGHDVEGRGNHLLVECESTLNAYNLNLLRDMWNRRQPLQ